jgi:hypothetical protein
MASDNEKATGDEKKTGHGEILAVALNDSSLPRIYANGFAAGLGNADLMVVFQLAGKPVAILNVSYTLAKTLAQKLGGLVTQFESAIGQELVTTDKVDIAIKRSVSSTDRTKH